MSSERLQLQRRDFAPVTPAFRRHRAPAERPVGRPVTAMVQYLVRPDQKPVVYISPPGAGEPHRTGTYTPSPVAIHDARSVEAPLHIDVQGFELSQHETGVSDFFDDEQVRQRYYPEMEQLVKQATGASRVLVFDHNVRIDGGVGQGASRSPVRIVHNDYTLGSAPQRVRDLLPDEADDLLRRRCAIVNAWRPIEGPVRRAPLAVIDARSVGADELVATDLRYEDRTGEIYEVVANPAHRWFYVPHMEQSEVLLIKGYDSMEDGRARFTPHTAFDDPTSPAEAPARKSIEIRSLVFFE